MTNINDLIGKLKYGEIITGVCYWYLPSGSLSGMCRGYLINGKWGFNSRLKKLREFIGQPHKVLNIEIYEDLYVEEKRAQDEIDRQNLE